jgi:hypothetical protein
LLARKVADVLRHTWTAKVREQFPDRRFAVDMIDGESPGITLYELVDV